MRRIMDWVLPPDKICGPMNWPHYMERKFRQFALPVNPEFHVRNILGNYCSAKMGKKP